MKRILILLLVLTLTVGMFAGCDMIQNVIGGFGQPGDETSDNGTDEDPTPAPDYLPDAVTFLHNIYKYSCKTKESSNLYDPNSPNLTIKISSKY